MKLGVRSLRCDHIGTKSRSWCHGLNTELRDILRTQQMNSLVLCLLRILQVHECDAIPSPGPVS